MPLPHPSALRAVLLAGILACSLREPGAASPAPSGYTQAMYEKALANYSTAPLFVLVKVRSSEAAEGRVVCIVAPFLLGAIGREYGGAKQQKIALSSNRTFTFKNPAAYENVQPRYTPEILEEARRLIKSKSREDLIQGLKPTGNGANEGGSLHSFYKPLKGERYAVYRDALAHALLERGILVGQGDPVGSLYLDRE